MFHKKKGGRGFTETKNCLGSRERYDQDSDAR